MYRGNQRLKVSRGTNRTGRTRHTHGKKHDERVQWEANEWNIQSCERTITVEHTRP